MQITNLVKRINQLLDGNIQSYTDLVPHLDSAMDDINADLSSVFPVFSDLPTGTLVYEYFPDRYLRECVALGAAYYFYMTDEEGGQPPMGYAQRYAQARFQMIRDYLHLVPVTYHVKYTAGSVSLNLTGSDSTTDPDVNPESWRI